MEVVLNWEGEAANVRTIKVQTIERFMNSANEMFTYGGKFEDDPDYKYRDIVLID